jgi:hypothetical protein
VSSAFIGSDGQRRGEDVSRKAATSNQLSLIEPAAAQLSLFEDTTDVVSSSISETMQPAPEMYVTTESKKEFELRRVGEMSEKLGWPARHAGVVDEDEYE